MKHIILLLFLIIGFNGYSNPDSNNFSNKIQQIDNGWYEASVVYFNPTTYTRSNYTLNVKVQYNAVVAIDFGNGGSVHSGYNNEGYFYSGGSLYFKKDFNGNITGATTTVIVIQDGTRRTFDISL